MRLTRDGGGLTELADAAAALGGPHRRGVLGLVGAPGAGKSTLAAALTRVVGLRAAVVPMDGFHLADVELDRQRLRDVKGAPETFDAWGYAALLRRLRARPEHPVYAPGFERTLEQPLAGAVCVGVEVSLVVTEGNYLLLDRPEWRAVRRQVDEVWFVTTADELRLDRLAARHLRSGKSADEARAWIARVDEPNARLVQDSAASADRLIDVSAWAKD